MIRRYELSRTRPWFLCSYLCSCRQRCAKHYQILFKVLQISIKKGVGNWHIKYSAVPYRTQNTDKIKSCHNLCRPSFTDETELLKTFNSIRFRFIKSAWPLSIPNTFRPDCNFRYLYFNIIQDYRTTELIFEILNKKIFLNH